MEEPSGCGSWNPNSVLLSFAICARMSTVTCIGLDLEGLEKHGMILVCNALFDPSPEKYTSNRLFEVYFRLQRNMAYMLSARSTAHF